MRLEPSAHAHFWDALSQNRAYWDLEQGDSTWGLSFLCSCWKGCVLDRMRQKDGSYSGAIARRVVCLLPAPSWLPGGTIQTRVHVCRWLVPVGGRGRHGRSSQV